MYIKGRILIVDDNDMNRKMTARLLSKLELAYDEASGGLLALDKVAEEEYSLILMDYRMPEMDGIETTIRIRRMEGEYYKEVPIFAMTADEREEMQERFLQAGMNGILQKPLQRDALEFLLKQWFAEEASQKQPEAAPPMKDKIEEALSADYVEKWKLLELDAKEGLKNCGEKELFESLVSDFYHLIDMKCEKLEYLLAQKAWKEYTIEVHALKNSARLIGAMQLSNDFANLENWGISGSIEDIEKNTPQVLQSMRRYKELLKPYMEVPQGTKRDVSEELLRELLQRMMDAVDSFDIDGVDEVMRELEGCALPKKCEKQLDKLKAFVADVALEDILNSVEEIIHSLEKAE